MTNKYLEKIAKFPGVPSVGKAITKVAPAPGSIAERIAQKKMARMMADIGAMKGRTAPLPPRR